MAAGWLGDAAYGVIGVVTGLNATALNFVDVRLTDLLTKHYYQDPPRGSTLLAYRASLIRTIIFAQLVLTGCFIALALTATSVFAPVFTTHPVSPWWIVANALALGIGYVLGPVSQAHRLQGRFGFQVGLGLVTTVVSSVSLLVVLHHRRDLDGFFSGSLLGMVLSAGVVMIASTSLWVGKDRLPLFQKLDGLAFQRLRRETHFLFWGNTLGYVKIGHRATDVLLVAWFADDRVTGMYKLARVILDKLLTVFDATNQVYQPAFTRLLTARVAADYRRAAERLLRLGLVVAGGFLCLELIAYPLLQRVAFGDQFAGSQASLMILTTTIFFLIGMQVWLWPLVVQHDLVRTYTLLSVAAVLAQYGLAVVSYRLTDSPHSFAAGYLTYYVVLFGAGWWVLRRRYPDYFPSVRR